MDMRNSNGFDSATGLSLPARSFLAALAIAATAIVAVPAAAGTMVMTKSPKCKAYRRDDQREFTLFWNGACEKGFIEGLGSLRFFQKKELKATFYGVVKKGRWTSGAYEEGVSVIGGPFTPENELQIQEPVDRDKIIQAFKDASAAADALAKQFKRDGNGEAAALYRKKAKQLRSQIE